MMRRDNLKLSNAWVPQTYSMITSGKTIKAEQAVTEVNQVIFRKGDFQPRNLSQCAITIANKCTQFFVQRIYYKTIMTLIVSGIG